MTLFSERKLSYSAKAIGNNWEFGIKAIVFLPVNGLVAQDKLRTNNIKIENRFFIVINYYGINSKNIQLFGHLNRCIVTNLCEKKVIN